MLIDIFQDALFGRNIETIDNLTFRLSGGRTTNWALANKLKNRVLAPGSGISDHELVVIGGCPRSGTTLLQMLLKAQNKIDGPYKEVCLFEDYRKYKKLSVEFDIAEQDIRQMRRASGRNNLHFFDKLFDAYKRNTRIDHLVLKAPKSIFLLGHLLNYYPKIRFIHVIRDGRDASLSMQRYFLERTGNTFPFSYGAKTWAVSIREGKRYRRIPDNYIEIRYEDLVAQPLNTMARVFEFLHIADFDEDRIINFNKHIEAARIATHEQGVASAVGSASVRRWKSEMTDAQLRIFENITGDLLTELGYDPA